MKLQFLNRSMQYIRSSFSDGLIAQHVAIVRQITALSSYSVGPSQGTPTRIKQGRGLASLISPQANAVPVNAALSPPIAAGNGFHQQPSFGAGQSAGQYGAPGHYGGAGGHMQHQQQQQQQQQQHQQKHQPINQMFMSYEEWERTYGGEPQRWIDLSTVDPRGKFSVQMKDIPQGAKATPENQATGLYALFEVGRSFLREGASAPSFICIRNQLCETECTPKKEMSEAHAKSHQMPALSVSEKVRLLRQAGINKIPRRK